MNNIIYDTEFFEMDLGFAYRFLDKHSTLSEEHSHNFYEYFFITSGTIRYVANGKENVLSLGDLVFIRPSDTHQYIFIEKSNFEMINISFSNEVFDLLCAYLGDTVRKTLLSPEYPPLLHLSAFKETSLFKEHEFLNFYKGDRQYLKTRLKFLLIEIMEIFIKYPTDQEKTEEREHLEVLLQGMNTQKNIEEGLPALIKVTGFSHGHLCRLMKNLLGTTPTEYIMDLRMVYAANLLVNSDMDILTISNKIGISSLSYFIGSFKTKYNTTPHQYRKRYAKSRDRWQ